MFSHKAEPCLSIVVPFFNEAEHLETVVKHICAAVKPLELSFELILIDDGSCDGTWQVIVNLVTHVQGLHALRLSRNFGKEAALIAGLNIARGKAVITMDGDLQHPPSLIAEMVARWREGKVDIVEAVKTAHDRGTPWNRLGARAFYGLQKKLTGTDLEGASDFKLLDRKVVDAWKQIGERNLFYRGLCRWFGYRRDQVHFVVEERVGGESKWSPFKLLELAMTGILSFSSLPLQLTTLLGLIFLSFSGLLGLQTLYMKLAGNAVSGFTTVILLLLITGSLVLISLGIIGAYLAQIYEEVKGRPRYLISEKITSPDPVPPSRKEGENGSPTLSQASA